MHRINSQVLRLLVEPGEVLSTVEAVAGVQVCKPGVAHASILVIKLRAAHAVGVVGLALDELELRADNRALPTAAFLRTSGGTARGRRSWVDTGPVVRVGGIPSGRACACVSCMDVEDRNTRSGWGGGGGNNGCSSDDTSVGVAGKSGEDLPGAEEGDVDGRIAPVCRTRVSRFPHMSNESALLEWGQKTNHPHPTEECIAVGTRHACLVRPEFSHVVHVAGDDDGLSAEEDSASLALGVEWLIVDDAQRVLVAPLAWAKLIDDDVVLPAVGRPPARVRAREVVSISSECTSRSTLSRSRRAEEDNGKDLAYCVAARIEH